MNLNVDLGQISIVTTISLVGWLLSNKISGIDKRLGENEEKILDLWKYLTANQHQIHLPRNFRNSDSKDN